jgi:hypothetical protein
VSGSRQWASGGSRRGRLHALMAAAGAFLLDPPETVEGRGLGDAAAASGLRGVARANPPVVRAARPVVAVFGLAAGCGATVVARALAAELAARDASGAAAVACDSRPGGPPLATKAATRLARALEDLPGGTRALGRLCLLRAAADPSSLSEALRGLAPLVIDAGSSSLGGVPACVADRTLVVTTPAIEPTLARVAIECVARVGPEPTLVINRARHARDLPEAGAGESRAGPEAGDSRPTQHQTGDVVALPESRLAAQLALGGRYARGGLGRAIALLADRWGEGG